ncbi:SDR family NAD(P)-dependent oxidoreductase [Aestuariirhabdus sp. Z084]|uniref:SDR family NAD(P)-dependent oxidoreductase n=1 Tax=Aestuariirhabdus haliotis TaxID=2918751 RepID=UPI00201B3B1E|nr:SDR family NAD(P)-dependent oxidoreductase [Aestuariirhabdus haliotis]MCL6417749.1 SDR family NAD(P)-dependent oxidoreductase [Aestuariirhabdus haliotis]MCL6421688.1 SDR family NAD(P)-dependent oxidoreductase [Aestuariirhabdus haliotis]
MSMFEGKTAVITGGAEGIGFSIAQAMAKQGMNIVIADIDPQQLVQAENRLRESGAKVLSVTMDVADLEQWSGLAEQTIERFGKVHMLVNNAGVGGSAGPIEQTDNKDWSWVLDVNLMGVVYGTQTMVPLMKQHGEGGWLINVASMAGMIGVPMAGAYTATKVAVVGMSESWYAELQPHNIQVSVLCPAFVKTRINLSTRNKQGQYKGDADQHESSAAGKAMAAHMQQVIDKGLAPEIVGERVVEAVKGKELYIFTHPNYRVVVQNRFKAIDAAFERAAASPLLADVLDEEIVSFS